jgi:HlyD family secretion protein
MINFKIRSIRKIIVGHKIVSVVVLVCLVYAGYWGYQRLTSTAGETRYVLAAVEKGTIVTSVSGSGQVSASNQVDIKPKVSGDVISVGVIPGQSVGAGALIAQIDSVDAQKAVRDAQVNLDSAKLSLEKLKKPADNLSLIQAQNSLDRAKESKQTAQDDLKKAYDDGFNTISNVFLDLPGIITGVHDILFSSTSGLGSGGQWNIDYYANAVEKYDIKVNQYKTDAATMYSIARTSYDKNFNDYKSTDRSSTSDEIEKLINETYDTTRNIAEAVKGTNNLIQFYEDKLTENNFKLSSAADTHLASLNTYTGKTNTHLLNLLNIKNTIKNDRDAIVNADRTITETTESLAKLKAGTDQLDIESAQLTIQQRENALLDAKNNLADYYIRAPFAGTVAKVSVNRADAVSAGTIVATLITKKQLAEISLNEIDAAKIKVGQKTTLTFDAIDGLSIAGEVAEIDTVGTVTQGVVTYAVKISFDAQDDRVKPGMSVNAAIITNVKADVLIVPNSAVKSQGTISYVEIFTPPLAQIAGSQNQGIPSVTPPRQQTVQTGLSNDTSTEIMIGLKEGDQVVTRTITGTTSATQTQAPSLFGGGGGQRVGGGGAGR